MIPIAHHRRKRSDYDAFTTRKSWIQRLLWRCKRRYKELMVTSFIGTLLVIWYLHGQVGDSPDMATRESTSGSSAIVIVTILQPDVLGKRFTDSVRENRIQYAARHGMRRIIYSHPKGPLWREPRLTIRPLIGYRTFFARPEDYDLGRAPASWTRIPAMRHALTLNPGCRWVWFLEQDAFIMNPKAALHEDTLSPASLERLMIRDFPVVPPDSIIRTPTQLAASDVDLVMSQDTYGLSTGSIVVRNSEWTRFFLDTWMDPMYRSYNFQNAEAHALVSQKWRGLMSACWMWWFRWRC